MKITKSKLKEFKSFSNRFHNSDTIRIKDKNQYKRIMKYLDNTKWPYYDIGGGKGAFHIQFDNTKDTGMIRGILQKKGVKITDPNTEGKLRETIREELLNEVPFGSSWSSSDARGEVNHDIKAMSKVLGKASQGVIKIMMDSVKKGKYDAMDLSRGIESGEASRMHFGEADFLRSLWTKVRDQFRRYSKGKLRR